MLDIVKQLFENNVISEEIKSEIESAWQTRIQENREQVSSELREEFAQKYEHDKSAMVEAVESMLADRLQAELGEFAEDRQGLIEARAKYAKKMKDDSTAMESFVLQNLQKEISELHEDRKSVAANITKLESFIVDALAKEIAEFHSDK
jgi:mRNA-degrading endonuclease toxin of MazEF toxin-antitoxin module